MTAFRHPPFQTAQSVRLLVLKPSLWSRAPIECELNIFSLSSRPRYEALSYTWEGQTPCRRINCNNSELQVTPNVEASLRRFRRYFFQRTIWIDAICIDQKNTVELDDQVSLMDQIYQGARRVLVWLGEGDPTSPRAIRTLKYVFPVFKFALHFFFTRHYALNIFGKLKGDFQDLLLQRDISRKRDKNHDYLGNLVKDNLIGLHRIVNHGWFRRIWTIQEIALAKKALVQCGGSKIRWSSLSTVLTFDGVLLRPRIPPPVLMEGGYNPAIPVYNKAPFMLRLQQIQLLQQWQRFSRRPARTTGQGPPKNHHHSLPFVYNVLLSGLNPEYMTSDQRDRIVGLLGVLSSLGIEISTLDHTKSLRDLVLEVFTAITVKEQSLELLQFVTGENCTENLPTWIPEFWLVPWCPTDVKNDWEMSETHFTIAGEKLSLSGVHIDTVENTTDTITRAGALDYSLFQDSLDLPSNHFITDIKDWLRFAQSATYYRGISQQESKSILFKLLLHSQVLRFYEDAGSLSPHQRFFPPRLFEHFSRWIDKVEATDRILLQGDDHVFDQVQNFISSELIIAGTDAYLPDHRDLGYGRAVLVIQRWVREYTARKRLFTTNRGHLGIGWRALRKGDLIVAVPKLRSPLIVRRVADSGSAEVYKLMGPCDMPTLESNQVWRESKNHLKKFELV